MSTMTLSKIVREHQSLDQIMLEQDGEITQADQEAIVDSWMAEIKSNLAAKADNYEYRHGALSTAAERLRARAKQISGAARVVENMADMLKDRMKAAMIEMTVAEVVGNDFKFKLSNGKPAVVILNESQIPAQYTREKVIIEVDKDLVKAALMNGETMLGAELRSTPVLRVTANKKVKELN